MTECKCTKDDKIINIEDYLKRLERRIEDVDNKRSQDTKEIKTEINIIKTQTEVQEKSISNIEKDITVLKDDQKSIKNMLIGGLIGLLIELVAIIMTRGGN